MRGVFKIGVCVSASAMALVMALSARVETQDIVDARLAASDEATATRTSASTSTSGAVTDAPAGFDGLSNGFAEEFCQRQDELVDSPNSPQIDDDECNFGLAAEEFTGPETEADGV